MTLGLNYSFGWHYTKSDINNPQAIGGIIGYEFTFFDFLGISTGVATGSFSQNIGYEIGDIRNLKNIYRSNFVTPYLSPKLYLEIGSDDKTSRAKNIYLENRFSYNKIFHNTGFVDNSQSSDKWRFGYSMFVGYLHPIKKRWYVDAWLGFNTLDYGRYLGGIEKKKLKTSTPFQIGVSFSYIIIL
jgi:hypothetical protein